MPLFFCLLPVPSNSIYSWITQSTDVSIYILIGIFFSCDNNWQHLAPGQSFINATALVVSTRQLWQINLTWFRVRWICYFYFSISELNRHASYEAVRVPLLLSSVTNRKFYGNNFNWINSGTVSYVKKTLTNEYSDVRCVFYWRMTFADHKRTSGRTIK